MWCHPDWAVPRFSNCEAMFSRKSFVDWETSPIPLKKAGHGAMNV